MPYQCWNKGYFSGRNPIAILSVYNVFLWLKPTGDCPHETHASWPRNISVCDAMQWTWKTIPAKLALTVHYDNHIVMPYHSIQPSTKRAIRHYYGIGHDTVLTSDCWNLFLLITLPERTRGRLWGRLRHRSITPKFVTPTAPSCIDNSWKSTTLPTADSASSNQTFPFQNEHE